MKKVLRNKWKRVCATVLAAAMTVTMLPANAQAAASTKEAAGTETQIVELVENGDFKTGTEGWNNNNNIEWQASSTIERVASGDDGYLKVSGRNSSGSGAMYDLSKKVKKGTTYKVKGKFKYDQGAETCAFFMVFQNGANYQFRDTKWGAIQGVKGEWVDFELDYTAGTTENGFSTSDYEFSTTENYFFIGGGEYTDTDGTTKKYTDYYIDDISITYEADPADLEPDEPDEPEGEEIIADGFENETTDPNWLPMGSTQVARTTEQHHEGSASLKVSGYTQSWEGGRYELKSLWNGGTGEKLIPGKKYTLTSWVKTSSGSDKISLNIKGSESDDKYDGIASADVNDTGWTKVSGEFTLRNYDQNPDYLEIYWTWNKTGAPPAFYIDDVSLIMNTDNLVRNGSFERDLDKWTANDAAEDADMLSAVTDEKHTGEKSVKVSNRTKSTNGPVQNMRKRLMPGSIYMVSAWVKYKDGADTRKFNLSMKGKEETTVLASGDVTKGAWTEIKGVWFMPDKMDNRYASLFVETADSNDTADFYVDDVSVLEYQDTTAALAKKFGYGNPITTNEFGADPYAIEYNGRVYVYMTADDYEFSDKDNPYSNNFGYITSLRVVSSADLMNWTDHGEIEVAGRNGGKGPAMWASHSWAPAIAYKQVNGKDKFFLYFANDASGIGVLEADTPLGPWTDPIGKALITKATPGCEKVEWCFDPAVLVEDDGEAYIYFGGGVPAGQSDNPKTARVAKLGDDMISLDGAAVEIDAPCMFEDSGIFKAGNTYYYSYCSNFTQSTKPGYPGTGTICYMTSENPMGPFTYQGEIFSNPSIWFGVGGNNHHATFTFNGKSYFIYHAQTVSKALDVERGYRSTHIDEIKLDENGKILEIEGTYKGISQLKTMNPYERVEAETIAWNAGVKTSVTGRPGNLFTDYNMALTDLQEGDWTSVSQLDFGSKGSDKITLSLGSKDGGTIDVIADHPEIGEKLGTITVPKTGSNHIYKLVTGTLDKKVSGTRSIFLVFHKSADAAGATTEDYKDELNNLWDRVKAAEFSLPPIEQLKRQITKANNVKSGFAYNEGDKTAAVQAKVNAANAVVSKGGSATPEEIKAAMDDLNVLIEKYDVYKATDKLLKEKLKYRIKYAEQLMEISGLADKYKTGLQEAIDSSKQLLRDDSIMNVDYFQFTEEGQTVPDATADDAKGSLVQQITAARDLLATLSGTKKTELEAAIAAAEAVSKKADATDEDCTSALNALKTAIDNAQTKEEVTAKVRLDRKIKSAELILESLSGAKKEALEAAIATAKGVSEKAGATDAELDTAMKALEKAIEDAKKLETVTVTLNGGEGVTLETTELEITKGDVIGELPTPTRSGYTFKGWFTAAAEGTKVTADTVVTEAMTIYAQWEKTEVKITVTLDGNGYTLETTEIQVTQGAKIGNALPTLTRSGYLFKGWFTAATGGEQVTADTVVNAAMTIYAQWEELSENECVVALDANEGTVTPTQIKVTKGSAIGALPTPTRDGYKFLGWYTAKTEGEAVTADTVVNDNMTIYARWEETTTQPDPDEEAKEQLKTQLNGQISEAQKVLAQLSDAEKTKLQTVINKVNALLTTGTATKEDLQAAVNELTQAVEAAKKTIGSGGNSGNTNNTGTDKPAVGQTFTVDGLTYIVTSYSGSAMTVTVTGADKQLTTLVIPAAVTYKNETFKVTAIGKQAFANQKSLKSVTVGENVTTIESGAFLNDANLTKITFNGAGVQSIANDAFKGINKKASFGMKVKSFTSKNIKYSVTKNTASAKEVTVTGTSAKKLTSLTVPDTVKYNGMTFKVTAINKKAFRNQKNLKSVTIGKNVKSIGNDAFSGAKKLAKVKFKGTAIKKIGKNAFKNVKKNATFSIKKSKRANLKKLLKKAKTKNYKVK